MFEIFLKFLKKNKFKNVNKQIIYNFDLYIVEIKIKNKKKDEEKFMSILNES